MANRNTLKPKIRLYNTQKICSYLTENTTHLHYEAQSVDILKENHCFLPKSSETIQYNV
jgi:hypothetical protein